METFTKLICLGDIGDFLNGKSCNNGFLELSYKQNIIEIKKSVKKGVLFLKSGAKIKALEVYKDKKDYFILSDNGFIYRIIIWKFLSQKLPPFWGAFL